MMPKGRLYLKRLESLEPNPHLRLTNDRKTNKERTATSEPYPVHPTCTLKRFGAQACPSL
jgi:hypothetical protein